MADSRPLAAALKLNRTSITTRVFLLCAASVLVSLLCPPSALAGDEATPPDVVAQAKALIFAGKPMEALSLLRPMAEHYPDYTDAHFFRGMAASEAARAAGADISPKGRDARKQLQDEAVASYRHILQRQPGQAGVRLELARALFERGNCVEPPEELLRHLLGDDCDAAVYHFRRALAGKLPEKVATLVSRYIAIVQARRRFSGQFYMALAPDSNVNSGTKIRTFLLRTLPVEFELNEEARQTSGVGIIVSASGDYRHPLKFRLLEQSATRLRLGTSVYRREHSGDRFDDMVASVYAGPEILFGRGRAGLLAKVDRQWYGGSPVGHGYGLRLEGGMLVRKRLWVGGSAERIDWSYRNVPTNDGPRLRLDLSLAYTVTPALTVGIRTGWWRVRAARPTLRSRTVKIGAFTGIDLPPVLGVTGFSLQFSHEILYTRYDAPGYTLITPEARDDRLSFSRVTLASDKLEWHGFIPALSLVHERRNSNIADIFDYQRNRAELSMQRRF